MPLAISDNLFLINGSLCLPVEKPTPTSTKSIPEAPRVIPETLRVEVLLIPAMSTAALGLDIFTPSLPFVSSHTNSPSLSRVCAPLQYAIPLSLETCGVSNGLETTAKAPG